MDADTDKTIKGAEKESRTGNPEIQESPKSLKTKSPRSEMARSTPIRKSVNTGYNLTNMKMGGWDSQL